MQGQLPQNDKVQNVMIDCSNTMLQKPNSQSMVASPPPPPSVSSVRSADCAYWNRLWASRVSVQQHVQDVYSYIGHTFAVHRFYMYLYYST